MNFNMKTQEDLHVRNISVAVLAMLVWKLKLKLGGWKFWKDAIAAQIHMRDGGLLCEEEDRFHRLLGRSKGKKDLLND